MAPRKPKQRVVIRLDGHALLVDDLTLAEFRIIEERTGIAWHSVNPMRSANEASAVLYVLAQRGGKTAQEAQTWVDALTLPEALRFITTEPYEHPDDRPKEYVDGVPVIDPKADQAVAGMTSSS